MFQMLESARATEEPYTFLRFDVFVAVRVIMMMMFLWVLPPCRHVGKMPVFRTHILSPIFSPEDTDRTYLGSISTYRRVYTAAKPKENTTILNVRFSHTPTLNLCTLNAF
jgi:hypothetical protein